MNYAWFSMFDGPDDTLLVQIKFILSKITGFLSGKTVPVLTTSCTVLGKRGGCRAVREKTTLQPHTMKYPAELPRCRTPERKASGSTKEKLRVREN